MSFTALNELLKLIIIYIIKSEQILLCEHTYEIKTRSGNGTLPALLASLSSLPLTITALYFPKGSFRSNTGV